MVLKVLFACIIATGVCLTVRCDSTAEQIFSHGTPPPTNSTISTIENNVDLDAIITQIFSTPTSAVSNPPRLENNEDPEYIIGQIFTNPPLTLSSSSKENETSTSGQSILVPGLTTSKPDDDLESLINMIFGNTTAGPVIKPEGPNQSSDPGNPDDYFGFIDLVNDDRLSKPNPSLVTNDTEDLSCTTAGGEAGECVPYYLCENNNTSIAHTDGLIDLHFADTSCQSYIDTCCSVSEKLEAPVTLKPDSNREGCGWRNPKGVIINSKAGDEDETKFAEFPWMCAILKTEFVNDKEPNGHKLNGYVGGGSLIHPSVVLTSAHSVATSPSPRLRVRAGEWDTQTIKEPYPYQDREVASIEVHQDFNKGNLFYDVAVLFLSQPIDMAPNVGVACLPPSRQRVPGGTRCFATGWGKDKFGKEGRYQVILKKIEVPVVEHVACQSALRMTRLGRFFELHSSFMCAGGEPGKGTCQGDGGSPLSCPIESEDGRYMQSGIVAWRIGCGEDGTPGVYVDVANLRSWVDDKVAGKGYDPKTYSF